MFYIYTSVNVEHYGAHSGSQEKQTENQAQPQPSVKIHETLGVQVTTTGNNVNNLIGKPITFKKGMERVEAVHEWMV